MHDHRQNFFNALGISKGIAEKSLLLWVFFAVAIPTACPGTASQWRHFTMSDGLPGAAVAGVTFSSKQKAWLRYQESNIISEWDGYDIASLEIPDLTANKVYESRSGQIWAIHPRGLYLWTKNQWQTYNVPSIAAVYRKIVQRLRSPVTLVPLQINQCLILANDHLHLFNSNPYLVKQVQNLASSQLSPFSEILECRDGDVLVAGTGGVIWFDGPAKDIEETHPRILRTPDQIKHYQLTSPLENKDGITTFLGEAEGETRLAITLKGEQWSWFPIPEEKKLRNYWQDAGGFHWGTSYNGLYLMDPENKSIELSSIVPSALFYDVASDGKGNYWIATSEGLTRQSPSYWQSTHNLLSNSTVFDIAADGENKLWLVTEEALMALSSQDTQSIEWPESMERIFPGGNCLFVLENDLLGINTGSGPIFFSSRTKSFEKVKSPIEGKEIIKILGKQTDGNVIVQLTSFEDDSHEVFWSFDGNQFQALKFNKTPQLKTTEFLWTNHLPPEIWFGAREGIAYANGQRWVEFESEDGLGTDTPHCMIELKDGSLWLGAGSYIYELQSSRWVQIYFAREKVNSLLEARDGTVWVASNNGVHRYFQETWLTHNTEEGLPSNTVYKLHEDVTGSIFAATTQGIARYVSQSDLEAPMTNIELREEKNQKDIKRGTVVTFKSIDKWNHTPAGRLLYSYRQDSETWKPFSHTNQIVLGDLSAGVHKIEVRAMDRNGNIEIQPPLFRFNFTIPWNEDPRLMAMTGAALFVTLLLTGLAVNRHMQLKRSYAEVEKMVNIRTQELERANKELLQDQKMKALGTLASGIAHDFNSILSIIKGSIQIIEANPNDADKIRKRVGRMHSVVDQGAGIVQSMLGYVRRKSENPQLHDLNRVVQDAVKLSEDQKSPHQVKYHPNQTIGEIQMAPDLVKQILINLINNAADAMDEPGIIEIQLGVTQSFKGHIALKPSQAKQYAVILIRDDGVGISAEIITRIFEPFYTTKAFSSRRGTGLGLSMVYEMAKEMGAGLSVDSTPGQGSQFFIYLPMDQTQSLDSPEGDSESDTSDGDDLRTK